MIYTTDRFEAIVSVDHYLEEYVDVETFLDACKACPNYGKIWSCPSYDFDVIEYWKQFKTLELVAIKIIFDESIAGKEISPEQQEEINKNSIWEVKEQLATELFEKEKEIPGSVSLSAGSCTLCKDGCTRLKGEQCRYPEKMR